MVQQLTYFPNETASTKHQLEGVNGYQNETVWIKAINTLMASALFRVTHFKKQYCFDIISLSMTLYICQLSDQISYHLVKKSIRLLGRQVYSVIDSVYERHSSFFHFFFCDHRVVSQSLTAGRFDKKGE